MLRFDVVCETTVTVDDTAPPTLTSEPMTDWDRRLASYRTRNARVMACKQLPGFGGFSLRKGFDIVIDGVHIALTPRLFPDWPHTD